MPHAANTIQAARARALQGGVIDTPADTLVSNAVQNRTAAHDIHHIPAAATAEGNGTARAESFVDHIHIIDDTPKGSGGEEDESEVDLQPEHASPEPICIEGLFANLQLEESFANLQQTRWSRGLQKAKDHFYACPTCQKPYNGKGRTPHFLPCGHSMCKSCISAQEAIHCQEWTHWGGSKSDPTEWIRCNGVHDSSELDELILMLLGIDHISVSRAKISAAPKNMFCAICGEPSTSRCAKCLAAFYCSKEHQSAHWEEHRPICKKFGRVNVQDCLPDWLKLHFANVRSREPPFIKFRQECQQTRTTEVDTDDTAEDTTAEGTTTAEDTAEGTTADDIVLAPKRIRSALNMPNPCKPRYHFANMASHTWPDRPDDLELIQTACTVCFAKLKHTKSKYPCGKVPSRGMMVFFSDGTNRIMSMEEYNLIKNTIIVENGALSPDATRSLA